MDDEIYDKNVPEYFVDELIAKFITKIDEFCTKVFFNQIFEFSTKF